jgi:tetratricopeptide (TPR) repeat protein
MKANGFWLAGAGIIFGFILGFVTANSLNRQEADKLRTEAAQKPSNDAAANQATPGSLTREEITQRIAEADKNPDNAEFQQKLGFSLYLYAVSENQPDLLPEAVRLLRRARKTKPDAREINLRLANVLLDLGARQKDDLAITEARGIYENELRKQPKDKDVLSAIAYSFLAAGKSDPVRAIAECKKALAIDPNHEQSLEIMTRAYALSGQTQEAAKALAALKQAHPQSRGIAELEALAAGRENSAEGLAK